MLPWSLARVALHRGVGAVNNTGAITLLSSVILPAGWYIKLTLAHTTVTQSYYY